MDWLKLEHALRLHAAKGGKTSRRRQADRVRQMARDLGKRSPLQVGRADVYRWIEAVPGVPSRRDRYYAARLFWQLVHDHPLPPPRSFSLLTRGRGEPA